MKHTTLLAGLLSFITANGQLNNGSFEQSGAPSLEGWEWTCSEPGQVNEAPPGAGDWHATKEAGQAKGCYPSYIYQRLTSVQDGDQLTISGWVRCDDDVICGGAYFGLGTINAGYIQLEETVGTNQFPWTYLTLTDTVELNAGDTAILVLNAGIIGGPISPEPGHFDGFTMTEVLSVSEVQAPLLAHYRDAANFYVAGNAARILSVRLLDLTGRVITAVADRSQGNYRIGLEGLGTGVYFVDVRTDRGGQAIRFVVQ
jgi:hypothetical protein